MTQDYSITTTRLSKSYRLYLKKIDIVKEAINPFRKIYHDDFFALKNISLNIRKGDIMGIIGPNGAGKSTLLKLISGILLPSSGEIIVDGKISSLLNPGEGFNPDFTGHENIHLHCVINGADKAAIRDQVKEIEEFADIGRFFKQPLRTYSNGMKARLSFAAAINVNPDILIIDEVLSVGDEIFRRKCYRKMEDFFKTGKTVLFVSHDVEAIKALCTNAIFLNKGEIEYKGAAEEVVNYYDHFIQSLKSDNGELSDRVKNHHSQKKNGQENHTITTSKSDIRITDFSIIEEGGEEKRNLVSGKSYQFRFKVYFGTNVIAPDFYIAFKDEKGVRISSLRYRVNNSPQPDLWYQIECDFLCYLLKGSYFIDIGIGSGQIETMNLSLIAIDVFSFRVGENIKSDPDYEFNGYFYMDQTVRVIKL